MTNYEIPAEVSRFILTSIPSIAHIEALILVHATAPASWNVQALAQRLYVSETTAGAVIDDLCAAGMLVHDPLTRSCHYAPNALSGMIDQVAALYAARLVEVTRLVHSRADPQAQHVAAAFTARKT